MASLNLFVAPIGVSPQRRVRTQSTAAKSSGGSSIEEKGILDFVLGKIAKQDQFYETDPILKKVEDKAATGRSKNSVVAPPPPPAKKEGGFGGLGGLFARK